MKQIKMTDEMIKQVHIQAKEVYANKVSSIDAQDVLVNELGMNYRSALIYIRNFQSMMSGEGYKRAMKGAATEYYLENILHDFGKDKLKVALLSVWKHIEYNMKFLNRESKNIRKIHKKFTALI